jgi:tetratricopeptide (TPR) repeat protein
MGILNPKNITYYKFTEANHFLKEMENSFQDDDLFRYNFSAFLSAARSVTFYMQKQYKRVEGFEEWYEEEVKKMKNDPDMSLLKDFRDDTIHVSPPGAGATRQKDVTYETKVEKNGIIRLGKVLKQSEIRTVRRWLTEDREKDVVELCNEHLKKIKLLVDTCESKFLIMFWYNLGNDYFKKNEFDDAIKSFEEAIKINLKDANALNNIGCIYFQKKEYNKAIEYFEKSIKLNPEHENAWKNLSSALLLNGEYDKSIIILTNLVDKNPDNATALYNFSCIYALKGDIQKSMDYLSKSINIDPKFKSMAISDSDFNSIKNNQKFRQIIGLK